MMGRKMGTGGWAHFLPLNLAERARAYPLEQERASEWGCLTPAKREPNRERQLALGRGVVSAKIAAHG